MRRIRRFVPVLFIAAIIVGVASAATRSTNLTLVAYSTPKDAYSKIIPAFQSTPAGHDVSFTQSYGPSADQSRNVLNGLSADVVAFSLAPDVTRLVKAGLVASSWNKDAYKGMVTDSVDVITQNPFTSGGARWNVMAAYGAQIKAGKTQKQAVNFLIKLFKNVSVQDKSAREALQTFARGKGAAR